MSHPNDYPMSPPEDFSTLEVRPVRTDEGLKEVVKRPPRLITAFSLRQSSGGVSALSTLKGLSEKTSSVSPPTATTSSTLSTDDLLPSKESAVETQTEIREPRGPAHKRMIYILLILVAVVGLAVGIPLGLHLRKGSNSTPSTIPTALPSAVPPSSPASATFDQSASHTAIDPSSKLASISWNGTDGVLRYRVYFQDKDQVVRESSWNASHNTWEASLAIGKARTKSPLAAVVTGPPDIQPVCIQSLYALILIDLTVAPGNTRIRSEC